MSTKIVDLPAPSPTAADAKVEIRGVRYEFRELTISEYDKLMKQATREEVDDDGETQEMTDSSLLLRLLILKSCVSPKITADDLNQIPTRIYRSIARVVNDLHYAEEPVKQIKDEDEVAADPTEETPKGNG
jgi:hypothetical protein